MLHCTCHNLLSKNVFNWILLFWPTVAQFCFSLVQPKSTGCPTFSEDHWIHMFQGRSVAVPKKSVTGEKLHHIRSKNVTWSSCRDAKIFLQFFFFFYSLEIKLDANHFHRPQENIRCRKLSNDINVTRIATGLAD